MAGGLEARYRQGWVVGDVRQRGTKDGALNGGN